MLEFKQVFFQYDQLPVLADLSLEVGRTEFVCLLGQSGSGKTTIINLAAGYLQPSMGEVCFLDKVVSAPSAERVVVFQEDALFPWFTVEGNAKFAASASGLAGDSVSIKMLLVKAGLSGFENTFPRQLSGGMKKRAELVRAFATTSRILLLDEPFGSLDIFTRQKMHRLLEEMWMEQRKCILMVTHDPEEALLLADRVVVLSARPGHVIGAVSVDWPRPRSAELKFHVEFLRHRRNLERLVADY